MVSQQTVNNLKVKASGQMRVLIVDDDIDILDSLKDILELEIEDCFIELASNVEHAKLLTQQIRPDIALLDIKIGQENGLELIQELKLISPDIVCIMMTAFRDNEYTITAVRFGANDYLYKPIKPQELILTVTRLFQEQRVKRAAAIAERRFFTVFEQSTQWLFLVDEYGQLIDANQMAMNFISNEKYELIGKTFWNSPWFAFSLEAQKIIQKGLSVVNTGKLFNSELTVVDDKQKRFTFELYMKPILNDKNEVEQVVIESRNITDRKKAEEEIRQLNSTLELRVKQRTTELEESLLLITDENKERKKAENLYKKAKEEAEKASAAKSDFLSRMSHELRTPMNAILGFGQLLEIESVNFTEQQKKFIAEILVAGEHLLLLINQVLNLTEIESGNLEVNMETVNLTDVISQCTSLIYPLIKKRNLKLIDNISSEKYILEADFTRLKQILLNLFSNAVKYNTDNGIITLDGEIIDGNKLRIKITDAGNGISEDDIGKLFTSFERLNKNNNVEGTGIGLVITKNLLELMDGTIGVASTLGQGSTFWFELKLAN